MPSTALVTATSIEKLILVVRGERVLLDSDIAVLYGVETKQLVRAVKRNRQRFPSDFAFQMNQEEFQQLRALKSTTRGGRRYPPFVFTEQGIAMLSGVLNSSRAIKVNIEIMRAFVRLRTLLAANHDLAKKLAELEARYDKQFSVVFDAIRELMQPPIKEDRRIGFTARRER